MLTEAVLENVLEEVDQFGEESVLDMRKEALPGCMDRLPIRHQQLIRFRYFDLRSYEEISGIAGKTVATLYVVFHRMHHNLGACIQRKIGQL